MTAGVFTLNLQESFPRLSRPPIVEAVIHWQARAQRQFGEDALRAVLTEKLPAYPQSSPIQEMALMATMSMTNDPPVVEHKKRAFLGLRLTSKDGRYIVQFTRDGLLFSRTQGYDHWEPFAAAAMEAWQIFSEFAAPVEIQRLGVRFINQLPSATPENLRDHLREPPTCPSNMPLKEFVYQSTFAVPGHPFGIRVIKVMQPSMPELQGASGLFLDIDVYSMTAIANEPAALDDALVIMRWLKNKLFFSLLTEEALHAFA